MRTLLQVMGDSSPAADKLMRSQGVRALPSFHFVSATLRAHKRPFSPTRLLSFLGLLLSVTACLPANPALQWKNKKQVDSISGAKTQALQDAIETNM